MKYTKWAPALMLLAWGATAQGESAAEFSTLNMPPGWIWPPTASMLAGGERCIEALGRTGVVFRRVEGPVGKIATPVVVPSMQFGAIRVESVRTDKPLVMDCHLALTFQRQSRALSDLGVRTLLVGRIYHTRAAVLRGRSTNLLSRHALGLAVDVRGFLTHRGQRLTVLRDYQRPWVRQVERLLHESGDFRAVVTPGNDRAHRDHFHLSAKMTVDAAQPDEEVDLRALVEGARQAQRHHVRRRPHARAQR